MGLGFMEKTAVNGPYIPPKTAAILRAMPYGIAERLHAQKRALSRWEVQPFGRLLTLVFEKAAMSLPDLDHEVFYPSLLQWEDEPLSSKSFKNRCPDLLITTRGGKNGQDLLCAGPLPHPPDMRDTGPKGEHWPPIMRPQNYSDRTTLKWRGFVVIQPVIQILYKPVGVATMITKWVHTGTDGTKMALLVKRATGEAYLVGGRI